MTDKIIEAWVEVVHWPRGCTGQGQPEWQAVLRGRTSRGLIRSYWLNPVSSSRESIIRSVSRYAEREDIPFRSAEIIRFPGREAA